MKTETQCQIIFSHYGRQATENAPYELKVAKNGVFHIRQMEEQQINFLFSAKHGTAYHKISDAGAISALPVDCFTFYLSPAYVVVFYETFFAFIDIDDVIEYKQFTEEQAKFFSIRIIHY